MVRKIIRVSQFFFCLFKRLTRIGASYLCLFIYILYYIQYYRLTCFTFVLSLLSNNFSQSSSKFFFNRILDTQLFSYPKTVPLLLLLFLDSYVLTFCIYIRYKRPLPVTKSQCLIASPTESFLLTSSFRTFRFSFK